MGIDTDNDDIIDFFEAEVLSASDYYPFGSPMYGRSFNSSEYRYGFNGQEKENELWGEGNASFFKHRISDNRLGRFFSVDPLAAKYPSLSAYSFVANSPIMNLEVDGGWWFSKSANNQSYVNHDNGRRIPIRGASEYAYTMSNVKAVSIKQDSYASYIPIIGNILNASALIQKYEDPTMQIDKGDIASIALGGYFKGTRKVVKAAGGLYGTTKIALDISEVSVKTLAQIATSPDLKESWVELAVMQSFANMKSENGNEIGFMRGDDQSTWQTTFHFSESFISELEENFGKEFDNLKDKSGFKREDYINSKVENHLKGMFENKKSEIMKQLE
jgi:RHS repeat-associated protein